jgi:hypothetical protein
MGWGLSQWWTRHNGGDELVNFDLEFFLAFFLAGKLLEQNVEACQILYCKWAVHCCCTRLFLIVGFHTMICWNVICWSDHHNQVITKTHFMFYKNDGDGNLRFLYWICDVCAQVFWGNNNNSLSAVANAHVWICEKMAHEIMWHLWVIAIFIMYIFFPM